MFPIGPVWDEVESNLRRHDSDDIAAIQKSSTLAYFEIAEQAAWQNLCGKVTIDFSDKGSENEMVLPSDIIRVSDVWDNDGCIQYFPSSWSRAERDDLDQDRQYRWFFVESVVSPLLTSTTLDITKGATTFTMDDAWSATYVGEYIRIYDQLGFWKLTADKTIDQAYNGEPFTNQRGYIRPLGTPQFSIRNRLGDFEERTVIVYYWRYPKPLCNRYDMVLLPHSRALELLTMIRVLGEKDKKRSIIPIWQEQYKEALGHAMSLNPDPISPRRPLDRSGRELVFGKWRI